MPGTGKLPDRATISIGIANPLTGVDALVHGSGNLHGWGQSQSVDPTLLYVRGFDQATQQYKYEVNPRFGTNRLASSVNRAPMQITLDLRLDVGPERKRQARQRTIAVEWRNWVALRTKNRHSRKTRYQPRKRPLHREDDARAPLGHMRDVAQELQRVAETLLAVKQDGLAR